MKRDTGSSMLTKWWVWDAVLENYWVEVDVIYRSKIKPEDLRRTGSLCHVQWHSRPLSLLLPSLPGLQSYLRPEKSSRNHLRHQEPNVCSPASGRKLPLVADRIYITPQIHETPAGLSERSENSPQDLQQVPLKAWVSKCLRSPPLLGEKDFEEFIRWNDRNVGRNFYITAASETQT